MQNQCGFAGKQRHTHSLTSCRSSQKALFRCSTYFIFQRSLYQPTFLSKCTAAVLILHRFTYSQRLPNYWLLYLELIRWKPWNMERMRIKTSTFHPRRCYFQFKVRIWIWNHMRIWAGCAIEYGTTSTNWVVEWTDSIFQHLHLFI